MKNKLMFLEIDVHEIYFDREFMCQIDLLHKIYCDYDIAQSMKTIE